MAIGSPIRSSLIPALLPRELLYSGIALNAIALTLSLVLGAVTARIFGDWFGFDGAFWWLAALMAAGTLSLTRLVAPAGSTKTDSRSLRTELRDGLSFVWTDHGIRALFVLSAVSGLLLTPVMFVTLQAHLKAELGRSAADAAPVLATMGGGIALSSLVIMRRASMANKSVKFMWAMLCGTGCVFLIGRSTAYWQVVVLALLMGLCGGVFLNMNQGLIQSNTPQEVMGRVMSLYTLVSAGLTPVGALGLGLVAEAIGTGNAISAAAALSFGTVLWMYLRSSAVRAVS